MSTLLSVLLVSSCSDTDDSSLTGKLKIEYGDYYEDTTWQPETLLLCSMENTDMVVKEITTEKLRNVQLRVLTGNYVLRQKDSGEQIALQILPDRTTVVGYYQSYFRVE